MLQAEKDRWNDKLWLHWQGIAPDAEEGMDDPDDPREVADITFNTIWDSLSFEDQETLIHHGKEIREAFVKFQST